MDRRITPEELVQMAKTAAVGYLHEGQTLDDSIVKVAQENELNPHQTHRLVEASNLFVHATLRKQAESKGDDRCLDFEIARPENVLASMGVEKVASEPSANAGSLLDYESSPDDVGIGFNKMGGPMANAALVGTLGALAGGAQPGQTSAERVKGALLGAGVGASAGGLGSVLGLRAGNAVAGKVMEKSMKKLQKDLTSKGARSVEDAWAHLDEITNAAISAQRKGELVDAAIRGGALGGGASGSYFLGRGLFNSQSKAGQMNKSAEEDKSASTIPVKLTVAKSKKILPIAEQRAKDAMGRVQAFLKKTGSAEASVHETVIDKNRDVDFTTQHLVREDDPGIKLAAEKRQSREGRKTMNKLAAIEERFRSGLALAEMKRNAAIGKMVKAAAELLTQRVPYETIHATVMAGCGDPERQDIMFKVAAALYHKARIDDGDLNKIASLEADPSDVSESLPPGMVVNGDHDIFKTLDTAIQAHRECCYHEKCIEDIAKRYEVGQTVVEA